jgi:16S rRNA A1518/A1519 N6-dimethyltransferase RsmA/KsgA/DIM1 with predicted DNA glycosylase/AP lyase activity
MRLSPLRPAGTQPLTFADKTADKLNLEQNYKGTTIIDMNPGLGIFSKTLYERLRPKSHILLEPHPAYQDHLREFKKPYAKMSLVGLDGYNWDVYEQIFRSDSYPEPIFEPGFVPPRPKTVPPEEGINTDLLFVGNLTRVPEAQRVTSQLLATIFNRGWLQQFGRVRFLLWMNDLDKERLLPQAVQTRARPSVIADTVARVTSIAGSGTVRSGKGFAICHLPASLDKMPDIPTPKSRSGKSMIERLGKKVQKELDKRIDWLARIKKNGPDVKKSTLDRGPTLEERIRKHLHVFLAHVDKVVYMEDGSNPYRCVPLETLIARYEAAMADARKSPEEKRAEAAKTAGVEFSQEEKDSFAEFEEEYLLAATGDRQKMNSLWDESYARTLNPPLLQAWEPRNNDTIIVDPDADLFPHRSIALLDFEPKLIHEWFRTDDIEEVFRRTAAYDRLVRAIFSLRAQTLKAALKTLAPGAENVLQMLPEEGKELGKKRVRCLSTDELIRVANAWKKWPFKPDEEDHMAGYNRKGLFADGHKGIMLK